MKNKRIIVGGLTTSLLIGSIVVAQMSPGRGFWSRESLPSLKSEEMRKFGLTCERVPQLMQFFLLSHVKWKTFDKELIDRTIKQYLKWVDGSKTLLLEGDIQKIKTDLAKMFERMSVGDCSALERVRDLLIERSKENAKFAESLLGPNYKFNESCRTV